MAGGEMIISLTLSDIEWLATMWDLEDMEEWELVAINARYRLHLDREKRALKIQHLAQEN